MENGFNQQRPATDEGDSGVWLRPGLAAPWREIVMVVFLTIGLSTLTSAWQAWRGSSSRYMGQLLTDEHMLHTLAVESAILGLLLVHLHRRGWRPADLRIKTTWIGTGQGLLLIPGMFIANTIVVVAGFGILYATQTQYGNVSTFILANNPHLQYHSIHVSWLAVLAALIFNGFFEEITCMGYAFNQFAAKRGPLFALVVTVLLRMSCHTYQGVVHCLGIGAAFFVTGLVYWYTRNLWPLILAHIIVDSVSFGVVKLIYG